MALSRRCKSSFRKDGHIHFEVRIICHIEKRVGVAIFDWEQRLVIGFIRDFERIIISDLPSVSPCIQEVQKALTLCALCWRCAECRWSGSGTKDLISGDFHSAMQRLNPGNNSLREIPTKGGRSRAVWAILFNDETLKRRGYLVHFRHEFRQIPLPSVVNTFSSGKLTAHRHGTLFCTKIPLWYAHNATAALEYRLSVDSQTTVVCNQPCPPPLFRIQPSRARLSLVWFPAHFASHTNRACEPNSFGSHCFVLTVGIHTLVKTPGNHLLNASIFDYPLHFLVS